MIISYYLHAWQLLLMFLAATVSVVAAFAGYVQSGGAEELLRGALNQEFGKAKFDTLSFNWKEGKIVVTNLRRDDYSLADQTAKFSKLLAKEVRLDMDLFPWPPKFKSITVSGMPETAVTLREGFLQSGNLRNPRGPTTPIFFEDCNLNLTIGDLQPLVLTGCSGELRRGPNGEPRGSFSLDKLNDRPFHFKLETLEDGRWIFTGNNIQIDTRQALSKTPAMPKIDPLLLGPLLSGEMGAEGTVSSLRLVIQPAADPRPFVCEGEFGFANLDFKLSSETDPAAQRVQATFFDLVTNFLGADEKQGENLWQGWMQVDRLRTGPDGHVFFRMAGGRLEFSFREGAKGALTAIQGAQKIALESIKGSVETDAENRPQRIAISGFLGNDFAFETRIHRNADRSRAYELLLEPRATDDGHIAFDRPVWRFSSRVTDYFSVANRVPQSPLADFELEANGASFPFKRWLPLGMLDLSGRMYVKGALARNGGITEPLSLRFDQIVWQEGSMEYGTVENPPEDRSPFGPLWLSIQAIFGTKPSWRLRDIDLQGEASLRFSPDLQWKGTTVGNVVLRSGHVLLSDEVTPVNVADLILSAKHTQSAELGASVGVKAATPDWSLKLDGEWRQENEKPAAGVFILYESNVPLPQHPRRGAIEAEFLTGQPENQKVNRQITVNFFNDGKLERDDAPLAK